MSFAGSRAIRSALLNTYAALEVFTTNGVSSVVGRERFSNDVDPTWPPRWNITAVAAEGSNLYTINWGPNPWPITIDGDGLRVYFDNPLHPAANFSIESAGDNLVRFHIPNVDMVWTLADDGTSNPNTPVTLERDTNRTGQR